MDTMEEFNSTNTRMSRTLNNPLLNLVLAASILSKITNAKALLQSPWAPFRPVFGYYPPNPSVLYPYNPFNPFIFNRFFPQIDANANANFPIPPINFPQIDANGNFQIPPLNQQQVIHIHRPTSEGGGDLNDGTKNKFSQTIFPNNFPTSSSFDQSDSSSNQQLLESESYDINAHLDQMETASSNNKNEMMNKNSSETNVLPIKNISSNEIPEPVHPYGKPVDQSGYLEIATITPSIESTSAPSYFEKQNTLTTQYPEDNVFAESNIDLQAAAASIFSNRQKHFNDDYGDDDLISLNLNKRQRRPTSSSARRPQKPRPYNSQPARINSKRGQYDDDYDLTTQRNNFRKPTQKRNPYRRRTPGPAYDFNEYEESRPQVNRRKTNKNGNRRYTTPAYDDYYDQNDNDREFYEDDGEYVYNRQKVMFRPRQQETTTESTTETSTAETSTTESTTETTSTTSVPMHHHNHTTIGYPYAGNSAYGNISFTYGPPVNNPHPGYGPSNGNEHVSITYGPPTGSNASPSLENWYNQYAKTSVIKRIQELLTPNNYYSPQYDANYNDSVF